MTPFIESLKRLARNGKLTTEAINNMACLNDEEKAYILAEIEDYEQAYKIVVGEAE